MEEIKFENVEDELRFAYYYSYQQYDRPLVNRMADKSKGGSGLSGIDGAAQAGMIRAKVNRIGNQFAAALTARYAPQKLVCSCAAPCCSGHKVNNEWSEAIRTLAHYAVSELPNADAKYRLYVALIARSYGGPKNITEIAENHGVSRTLASEHAGRVSSWVKSNEGLAMSKFQSIRS